MNVLVLGFNEYSREYVDKVKRFPEYGKQDSISIYHIFVTRNSLSYGKDLVVEIPDPHGDGYRTYKDGLQAVDGYSTTVSDYLPWLLEEAAGGSFNLIVDLMLDTSEKSLELISLLKEATPADVKWLTFDRNTGVDSLISETRSLGGYRSDFSYVEFSREFLEKASTLWEAADRKMRSNHINNRSKDVEAYGHPDKSMSGIGYAYVSCIPDKDISVLDHVTGATIYSDQPKSTYRKEYVDKDYQCLVIEDTILVDFFGEHHVEQVACRAFADPTLKISSAKYVKYLSNDSKHLPEETDDFVIEYVHNGTLKVLPTREPLFVEYGQPYEYLSFSGDVDGGAGYPYSPSVNPPADRIVEANLETIIFTFKRPLDMEIQ